MRRSKTYFFAIPSADFDHTPAREVIDILRYEGASPLCNAPDGWLAFQKRMDQPVTRERLASFGLRRVIEVRCDAEAARGSCPSELRYAIEDSDKRAAAVPRRSDSAMKCVRCGSLYGYTACTEECRRRAVEEGTTLAAEGRAFAQSERLKSEAPR